ncbi:hypothetical protein DQB62_00570 [Shigella flexneri]|nr:hypothetical protein [Shigella flexneri]
MTFPSEVIYELANTLRRYHSSKTMQTNVGATADFLRGYFLGRNPTSITQETVFSIERTSLILPIDNFTAFQERNTFNFSMGMLYSTIAINPIMRDDPSFVPYQHTTDHGKWFVVVEQGANQYDVVAARDEAFFDLGQIYRRQEIAFDLRQGNIGLSGAAVYFILSSWSHVGFVLMKNGALFNSPLVKYHSLEEGDRDEEETVPGTEVAVCENYDDLKSVLVKRDVFESLNLDFPGDENEISVADLVEALCQKDQANEISDEEAELFQVQQLVSKVISGQEIVDTLMALPPKKRTQKYIRELVLEKLGQTKK